MSEINTSDASPEPIIAFQGHLGAYSHLACRTATPAFTPVPCGTFTEAMQMVEKGAAELAMIPIENSTAGRVEEIYRQLPKTHLSIIGEHFESINHCLIGLKGSTLTDIQTVCSHPQALAQCDNNIMRLGLATDVKSDTAGAAREIMQLQDKSRAAIASSLAAELYEMEILQENFQDFDGNTTRFIILSRQAEVPAYEVGKRYLTSLMFRVRNMPAALYKAMGGFATNGINMIKLESYMNTGSFQATSFYVDVEAHQDEQGMINALEELAFFAQDIRILGTYQPHQWRKKGGTLS
ncbi:prephenate dehydratase [Oceanospirillum multiglobuliferum]|uniref:prephenate dehydratase n=1 Tax=Oceanospirillum multiglobuliferum TaxID=64969 RepID=UPI0009C4A142|nr:prephenate dehydratase [Oceanospirillum multiglobuliferum]SJZ64414.1 prephenate dehydratase [Oceanospirillum multiglobuliferum]